MKDIPVAPAIALCLIATLYIRGYLHSRDRSRVAAFVGAWLALAAALASPLHPIGEQYLSAHMVQHVLLMAVAAPLLVWSTPVATLLRGMPMTARRCAVTCVRTLAPARRRLSGVATACTVQAVLLWGWHMPAMYQASVQHDWVHAAQHSTMLIGAILFWASIPLHSHNQSRLLTGVASLFATTLQMGILAALLTFSHVPWYPVYVTHGTAAAVADQQIAGLIMWVPGALPYIGVALAFVWRALRVGAAPPMRATECVSTPSALPS